MPIPVTIPMATITLEQALVLEWKVEPGNHIYMEQPLFDLETDKVVMEVPSPGDGVLLRIDVPYGLARVGQIVAWIGERGELLPEPQLLQSATPPVPKSQPAGSSSEGPAPPKAASPAARRRARELLVDLGAVLGTGPGGRITEKDVEKAAGSSTGQGAA